MLYIVTGADGAELKSYKTLAVAKKLAEATEGAVVFYNGRQVYPESKTSVVEAGEISVLKNEAVPAKEEKEILATSSVEVGKKPEIAPDKEEKPETFPYKVIIRVNIRKSPSLEADKLGGADAGTILEAYEDLGDWLKIRYNGGIAYARHNQYEYIRKA